MTRPSIDEMRAAMRAVREAHIARRHQAQKELPKANLLYDLNLHEREWVHVRLLQWLLDCREDATHECGSLFLIKFLETVGVEPMLNADAVSRAPDVNQAEYVGRYATSRSRPDLVIAWVGKLVIMIEEKILAAESNDQLGRYAAILAADFADVPADARHLVFLTIDGRKPSSINPDIERGRCRVVSVSLPELASQFINAYASVEAKSPYLERLLRDYQSLVKRLQTPKKGPKRDDT